MTYPALIICATPLFLKKAGSVPKSGLPSPLDIFLTEPVPNWPCTGNTCLNPISPHCGKTIDNLRSYSGKCCRQYFCDQDAKRAWNVLKRVYTPEFRPKLKDFPSSSTTAEWCRPPAPANGMREIMSLFLNALTVLLRDFAAGNWYSLPYIIRMITCANWLGL